MPLRAEDVQLGDVLTFGTAPTEFIIVDVAPVRFLPKDTDEARRVLAQVRSTQSLDERSADWYGEPVQGWPSADDLQRVARVKRRNVTIRGWTTD